jgi:hypothetical protein
LIGEQRRSKLSQDQGGLADADAAPFIVSPAEFGSFIADETEKWGEVIRAANIEACVSHPSQVAIAPASGPSRRTRRRDK